MIPFIPAAALAIGPFAGPAILLLLVVAAVWGGDLLLAGLRRRSLWRVAVALPLAGYPASALFAFLAF